MNGTSALRGVKRFVGRRLGLGPRRLTRYEHLLRLFQAEHPRRMIEIGVWRGDRAVQFLTAGERLEWYVGLDLFEAMDEQTFQGERMGGCAPHSLEEVQARLRAATPPGCRLELQKGFTQQTLPPLAARHPGAFDFIYIDGGHSLETIANDWTWAERLLAPGGVVVLDDYYLNNATRGAKPLVERLLGQPTYQVRFFPVIEDIVDGLQITMVSVRSTPAHA